MQKNLIAGYIFGVATLFPFGMGRIDAATVGVDSVNVDVTDNELLTFAAGGLTYSQQDLIQPTLTAFAGGGDFGHVNIGTSVGGSVPAAGNRSTVLTHDFYVDTGIFNPEESPTAATVQFSPALINGPGPDLVLFEADSSGVPDTFAMQVNGFSVDYFRPNFGPMVLSNVAFHRHKRDLGTPTNITQLENDAYSFDRQINYDLWGIAIDLDDFGVASNAPVADVNFGAFNFQSATNFDPVLLMGVKTLLGDFNGDRLLNCFDIDSLVAVIAAGTNDPTYDLTGDGIVDPDDLDEWRVQGGAANLPSGNAYLVGDATLDGTVDGLDFIAWNDNKFTSVAAWCSGDFNAEGTVDGLDYILWNGNKFTSSDSVSAVPEPGMGVFLMTALIGLAVVRWR